MHGTATTLLLYKIQPSQFALKSFLIYLNSIKDNELTEIEEDQKVLQILGKDIRWCNRFICNIQIFKVVNNTFSIKLTPTS